MMKGREVAEETADQAAKREERRRRREQQEREAQATEQDESLWENVYQFSTFDATVAEEFGGEACVGGTQWPGGVRVARYLDNRLVFPEGALAGKRLLDLGAGCGLVSVVAARLGARVLSTDKDIVMGVLNDNLSRNGVLHVPSVVEGEKEKYPAGKATVEELWWGPEVTHPEAPFDIIIAAACLYLPKTVPLLLQTLHRLSRPDTLILLTMLIGKDTFVRWTQEVHKWFEVEGRGDDGEVLGYGRQQDAPPGHRLLTDLEMATNVLVLKRRELGEGVAYGLAPEDREQESEGTEEP